MSEHAPTPRLARPPLLQRLGLARAHVGYDEAALKQAAQARSLIYLFLAGATLLLCAHYLVAGPSGDTARTIVIAASGYAIATVLLIGYERIPSWSFGVFLACGTMLTEWAVWASGQPASPFVMFSFWIAIYAFYFLPRWQAILQLLLIASTYGAVLLFIDRGNASLLQWLITSSALVVAGALIGLLKDHIDSLAKLVHIDTTTGMLNRHGLRDRLETDLERARRSRAKVSVVVAEIDGIWTAGARRTHHAVESTAEVVDRVKRRMDSAARSGPLQFSILVPDTDCTGATMLAERIRRATEMRDEEHRATLSLGVATFPDHAPTVEGLIHASHQALEAAKRLGGNCAVTYNVDVAKALFAMIGESGEGSGEDLSAALSLAEVLDIRDTGTASHSRTVGRYAEGIARGLGLPPDGVERARLGGLLHDIGKIAVPDSVLCKPGPLDNEEWEKMRRHPEIGALILEAANLDDISRWVMAHHERPDGSGYPRGLGADEIPLGAKILAVADAYEAMTNDRPYRRSIGRDEAHIELQLGSGSQFDAQVVDSFLRFLHREGEPGAITAAYQGRSTDEPPRIA